MNIATIIAVLKRDGALNLNPAPEIDQPRVGQDEVAKEVDLGRLFPSKPAFQSQ